MAAPRRRSSPARTESGLQAGSFAPPPGSPALVPRQLGPVVDVLVAVRSPIMTVRSVRLVAVGCVAAFALAACGAGDQSLPAGVAAASGRAPALPGTTLNGGRVPDLGGKVVVVNFWNPYCPPCRVEAPALEAAAKRYADRGVDVVGVHYTGQQWPKSVPAALSFVRAAHLTYPVVADPGAKLATEFGIAGIPTTVIVDATGRMRFRVSGPVKAGVLDDLLAEVLGASATAS